MTTFAKKTFDAAGYLKNRPTYSASFIQHVIQYARPGPKAVALDLGCGPGQATTLLAASGSIDKIFGIDPSPGMIEAAQSTLKNNAAALLDVEGKEKQTQKLAEIIYKKGSAEDLDWLEDQSIDLVTAGQAAHWFEHDKVYAQLKRILRPGGTVAYWGYSYLFLPGYPATSPKILKLGLETLKSYWQPGRKGPDSLYDLVPFPSASADSSNGWDSSSFIRYKFDQTDSTAYMQTQDLPSPPFPQTRHFPITMTKSMDFEGIRDQIKTWSSVHTYTEKHKSSRSIVDSFIESLEPDLPKSGEFQVSWPLGLLLMKKRA